MKQFFITGTDTGVGKTLISAIVMQVLKAHYWKPIQSGLADEISDRAQVQAWTNFPSQHFFDSHYNLQASLSPNIAADLENKKIHLHECQIPTTQSLVVEGAGGVCVPVNEHASMLDLMKQLDLPVIIVSRGALGTINHTLLTIEALLARAIKIHGVVFNGEINPASQKTIETWGKIRTLFHVPRFQQLTKDNLQSWIRTEEKNIQQELT
ncbi:MAG: dethiobiotin synthase [Gammaproteobacteria bacterium]